MPFNAFTLKKLNLDSYQKHNFVLTLIRLLAVSNVIIIDGTILYNSVSHNLVQNRTMFCCIKSFL